jgi:hypothetical protein
MARKKTHEQNRVVDPVEFAALVDVPLRAVVRAIGRGRLRGFVYRNGMPGVRLERYEKIVRAVADSRGSGGLSGALGDSTE